MWKPMILDVECIVCNKTLQKIKHDPEEASRKMVRITNRRSRTPNWSLEEKQYLLELIKEHRDIVIIKSNNGPNHYEEKDVAWNEILRKLALKFGTKFTDFSIKKLKTQWQNMKRIAREEIVANGKAVQNYSKQSLEVCNILDLIKDGEIKKENENNETAMATNVEIKTECIDEDYNQADFSGNGSSYLESSHGKSNDISELSTSPISEQTEVIDANESSHNQEDNQNHMISTSSMTETPLFQDIRNIMPFHREMEEFIKYTTTEKQLKMESLKEERQVFRAMRETAELNKIIAEQKLKHILWMKNREISMYSGEPGSGAGKGGGGGGAIREAGGSFGKMEAAREDEYFYKKQKEQLANMKGHLDKEIAFHQEQIKRHEDAIRRHKEQMADMNSNK